MSVLTSLAVLDRMLVEIYLPVMREIVGSKTLRWVRRDGNILCYVRHEEFGDTYEALLRDRKPNDTYTYGRLSLLEDDIKDMTPEQFTRYLRNELVDLAKEFKLEFAK